MVPAGTAGDAQGEMPSHVMCPIPSSHFDQCSSGIDRNIGRWESSGCEETARNICLEEETVKVDEEKVEVVQDHHDYYEKTVYVGDEEAFQRFHISK